MAGGMEAQNRLGTHRKFDPETLPTDGNTAIGADLEHGANAPNIRPPGAARGWAQDGAFRFPGDVPGFLRSKTELAVNFVSVAMEPQSIDVRVGGFHIGNLLAGEIGRESTLPELVLAFDFPFGLRGWSIKETNVVEFESGAELGQRVGILREKYGVIIDVDLEGATVAQEGGGQEIEVRQESFSIIEFGGDEQTAAIVEHIDHGKVQGGVGKPAMG